MKKWIIIVAAFAAIAIIGTVSADTGPGDQGRRLAGPFCINNNTGVVRAVAVTQKCKAGETRKVGVAVPCNSVTIKKVRANPCVVQRGVPGQNGAAGAKGETGATGSPGATGAQGAQGATGAAGAAGAQGPKGADGKDGISCFTEEQYEDKEYGYVVNPACVGPKGDTGSTGATGAKGDTGATGAQGETGKTGATGEQGPKGDKGYKGDTGSTGATGAAGPKGDTGAAGPKGDTGANGKDGKDGLGDGTRWICVHGKWLDNESKTNEDSNGGPLFDGGTGEKPDCKGGAKFAFKVVTSGDIWNFGDES
jgi:hypothetical protein